MSVKTFELNILTPSRKFYHDQVEMITVDAIDGSLGLLKGASNQVIGLVPGVIKIIKDDETIVALHGSGYIQIKNGVVVMLVETAEWPSEIDILRAEEVIAESEEAMRLKKSHYEYTWGKANIARSLARLKVKNKDNM
ncbi:MAG: F0F1 ATP synthase subunit epsilon [Bacilli bacterium]|jgi:F-type H+-transporting ATPase subunit epsilon